MAKQTTEPGLPTLEDVLGDAEAHLQLEVPDFVVAHVRIANGIDATREATQAEVVRRAAAMERFDGGAVARCDVRLATLKQLLPDLEKAREILHEREGRYLAERARVELPSLLEALRPRVAALDEALRAQIAARGALKAGADAVRDALSRIPSFEVPTFTEDDYSLADEVDRLVKSEVVGEEILRVGPPNVRAFSLPTAPRDPGPVRTVTMDRPQDTRTIAARGLRGGVG